MKNYMYWHLWYNLNKTKHILYPLQWCHMSFKASHIKTQLFVEKFVQANNTENTEAPHSWPYFYRNAVLTGRFLSQRDSNEGCVFIYDDIIT